MRALNSVVTVFDMSCLGFSMQTMDALYAAGDQGSTLFDGLFDFHFVDLVPGAKAIWALKSA